MFGEGKKLEEKKNGEGKGGKYLEKEKIFVAEEKKSGGKYLEKENRLLGEGGEGEEGGW